MGNLSNAVSAALCNTSASTSLFNKAETRKTDVFFVFVIDGNIFAALSSLYHLAILPPKNSSCTNENVIIKLNKQFVNPCNLIVFMIYYPAPGDQQGGP
jgi:hypothetical protein